MTFRAAFMPLLASLPPCLAGCGQGVGNPVSGAVLIDGVPRPLVVVQFRATDPAARGNSAFPMGITDAGGRFSISTGPNAPGAAEGAYAITLEWMSGNELGARDLLGGRYADPARSRLGFVVRKGNNEVPLIDISSKETR